MDTLLRDVRFALKLLRKDAGFAGAALLTLALCIGANTAIFSVVRSVLLKPLPYPSADHLVVLYNSYPNAGAPRGQAAVPDYLDRQREMPSLEAMAMYQDSGLTIGDVGSPQRVPAAAVTPSMFRTLGVPPAAGRTFDDAEGEEGNDHAVVLSWGLWQEMFGGRADAIGQDLRVDGVAYPIVGVMPKSFRFPEDDTRFWVPLAFSEREKSDDGRHNNNWSMIARLKPDVPLARAQAEVDAINQRNLDRFPQFREILINAGYHTVAARYRDELTRDVRATFLLLQGGVLLVLLIGVVNITNLVLVRATVRGREMATRYALGAGRWRMARQLLTESVVLAVLGGVIGLGVGRLGLLGLASLGGMDEIPRSAEIGMDWQVVAITMVAATIAGLLFGLAPLARVARGDLSTIFRQEGRGGTAGRGALNLRGGLVVAQVALAFTLLAGTGLLLASLSRTLRVDPGFRIDNVLTAAISMPSSRYPGQAPADFLGRAIAAARGLPGVRSAAATSGLPFSGDMSSSAITPEGYRLAQGESPLSVPNRRVTPGYFETFGIPVVRGRDFGSQDGPESTDVVIIDEWLAHRYWPDRDPIGQRIFQGVYGAQPDSAIEWMTIVGVVGVTRLNSLAGDEPNGHYYVPLAQAGSRSVQLVLATSTDPTSVAAPLRGLITGLDPDMPVYQMRTMEERVGQSLVNERGRVTLLVAFAAVALFLAAIGLYGE
jgi:predicted permease